MTVYEKFRESTKKHWESDFALFSLDGNSMSYGELFQATEKYASYLADIGIGKGARVTVYLERARPYFCVYFSLIKLGAVIHTIDVKSNLEESLIAVDLFKTDFFVTDSTLHSAVKKIGLKGKCGITEIPDHEAILSTPLEAVEDVEVKPEDPAVCIFTSGTTGTPKGILSSYRNILVAAEYVIIAHKISESDVGMNLIPMSSINGQVTTVWAPLFSGGSVLFFQDMFSTFTLFSRVEEYKITWISGVPTHFSILLNTPVSKGEFDLSSLRFMRSASAPLPLSVQERFESCYGVPIVNTMGLSEMTGQVFACPMDLSLRKPGSVGQPVNNQARVIGSGGKELPPGEEGEIIVTGENLMTGYYGDEEATRKAIRDGWLYTGDLGYRDKDNFFFISGRKKDIVIVGGQNVSLKEVDDTIYSIDGVLKTASIGVTASKEFEGEQIIAFIVKTSDELTAMDVKKHCAKRLSYYKVPAKVVFVESLPEGGTGKILRSRVVEMYREKLL